jgi:caa(3)-type oxidase subunit IV
MTTSPGPAAPAPDPERRPRGESSHGGGEHAHASVATYVKIAIVLTALTALEFAVIYIRALTPILVPLLLVMSAGKFALVALFFMHLRYDRPILTTLFAAPLVIAIAIIVAMMTLTDAFLIFER